jgi:predicted amidophosphoribosyltransferase
VYVHLNSDDVNQAIREHYGLGSGADETEPQECPFCGAKNRGEHAECRQCGRPLSLEQVAKQEEKLDAIERLQELEENGILDKLEDIEDSAATN